jgi:hypothetical protein
MNELTPKQIKAEDVSNLVWIVNSRTDFWDQKTKSLAKVELKRRKNKSSEINEFLNDFNNWTLETEKEWEEIYKDGIEENDLYDYREKFKFSTFEKILIVVTAPLSIKYRIVKPNLIILYREKKMKMFWEKFILLVFGFIIWIGILNYSYELSQKKRMEEIEKIDITEWEKEHGYDK